MKAHRLILIASLFSILLAAWFSQGFHHPDEYFQIFEFASWKAGITPAEDLPWEFAHKMRPSLQPALVYGVIKAGQSLGWFHPFHIIAFFRGLAGVLFFITSLLLWKKFASDFTAKNQHGTLLFLALLIWLVPYLAVRFSSENVAGCLFFLALVILKDPDRQNPALLIFSGFLMGLAFHVRYQMAFAIAGTGLWLLFFNFKKPLVVLLVIFGGLLALAGGILLDCWFYGDWILAPYNYYIQNIVMKKAAGFGVEPWYFYLKKLAWGQLLILGPVALLGYSVMTMKHAQHPFLWASLPFIVGHSLVAHKELRFLLPLFFILPYTIISGFDVLGKISFLANTARFMKKPALVLNAIFLLITALLPPSDNFWFLKNLYDLPINPGSPVVYEEENNYLSPYHDGFLRFTFLKNREQQLKFTTFSAWSRTPHSYGMKERCPVFICKLKDEARVTAAAEKHCGKLSILYQNLYAPLLRALEARGFRMPPDVKAYVIYVPDKDKRHLISRDINSPALNE